MRFSVLTSLLCLGLQSSDASSLETTHPSNAYYISKQQPRRDLAVLLIDMQEVYRVDLPIKERYKEIPFQVAVLNYAQENGFPVVVIQYDIPSLRPYGIELMPELEEGLSLPYETIHKRRNNAFQATPLDEMLQWYDIQDIVLIGTYASDCVMETGNGALMNGYSIATSPDLIIDPTRIQKLDLNESQEWYAENGTLFSDYNQVIDYMETKTHEDSLRCVCE
jgi:isochorismate hydrolase